MESQCAELPRVPRVFSPASLSRNSWSCGGTSGRCDSSPFLSLLWCLLPCLLHFTATWSLMTYCCKRQPALFVSRQEPSPCKLPLGQSFLLLLLLAAPLLQETACPVCVETRA